jgi:hypothetical protein
MGRTICLLLGLGSSLLPLLGGLGALFACLCMQLDLAGSLRGAVPLSCFAGCHLDWLRGYSVLEVVEEVCLG